MTESTHTFSGQRLRIARLFRGMTQSDVGEALGISHQFICDLERELKSPTNEMTRALGDLLGFMPEFFYGLTLIEFLDSECNFRRRRVTPISIRARALAFGTLFGQFWSYATAKLNIPSDAMPILQASNKAEIEQAVEWCQAKWGIDPDAPIKNMVHVIERAGVPVARFGSISQKVDAFSRAGQPSVVVLSNKPPSNCRLDLAHECAHLVLHRDRPTGTPEIEREADYFARALLLPHRAFRREFPRNNRSKWETLFQLKRRWRTSLVDIVRRASDLSLINGVEHLRLYKEMSRQGWLKAEPYEFEHESPAILPRAFEQLKTFKGTDHSDIAHALGWTVDTLVEITNVQIESRQPRAVVRSLPLGKVRDA